MEGKLDWSSLNELFRKDHPWGEVAYWVSQVGLFVVALVALLVARSQVKAFSTFELTKLMHDRRLDRETVLIKLRDKPFSEWSEEETQTAARVCASYDLLGHALRSGFSSRKFFIRPGASSISRTYETLRPYIEHVSSQSKAEYWPSYKWLYCKAKRWYRR
jgi:hypothetical protein